MRELADKNFPKEGKVGIFSAYFVPKRLYPDSVRYETGRK